jgi:hypothetical protein
MTPQSGNGKPEHSTQGKEASSQTEEFLRLLPPGFADEIGLDENASRPIYPPGRDLGSARAPNPDSYGRDWRLLAPPDSEAYQAAIRNPRKEDSDENYQRVLGSILDSIPNWD